MTAQTFAQVGIDTPVRKLFDYRVPTQLAHINAGMRVQVPFGRRKVVGVVMRLSHRSEVAIKLLKDIDQVLDTTPLLDRNSLTLIEWAASYYQHPIGAALFAALPPSLRKINRSTKSNQPTYHWISLNKKDINLSRAPKQAAILQYLIDHPTGLSATELNQHFPNSHAAMQGLEKRGLIERRVIKEPKDNETIAQVCGSNPPHLTKEQQLVSAKLCSNLDAFSVHLVEGVTGSGKTEVYFSVIEKVLANSSGQVLVLVPEIGLTPQLLVRLQNHFKLPIGLLHSNIRESERKETWLKISSGKLRIVLGTRLAVFTPMPALRLIVVDEEHDASLKQHEGFLYHARDVAIYRAQKLKIPIILGSATPSFESLHNVNTDKFKHHVLATRVHSSIMPAMHLVDMRTTRSGEILSAHLIRAMHAHLKRDGQVILFLNRRGYAPALLCHDCGWVAQCSRCDANMTYHARIAKIICHHCDSSSTEPKQCPMCSSNNLIAIGHGTQRIEEILSQQFSTYSQIRLDRDATRRKGNLEKILTEIRQHKHQIIIGTQMLSKGHDFPNVSLVGVLDVDYGIFSSDYRALERTAQLLIQVAGRSGRRNTAGEVFVQTHAPDHPLLNTLLNSGYATFAANAMESRATWKLPPYSYQIILRANSQKSQDVSQFLRRAKEIATNSLSDRINIAGPINASMEKKAGQFRACVLLAAEQRKEFGKQLDPWLDQLSKLPEARKVRWNIDVDPIEGI